MSGNTLKREQTKTIVDNVFNKDVDLTLLTGQAGSGKSGIIRAAIEGLRTKQTPHLAFRVDHHLSCNSVEELGKQLTGRNESPVSTLKGTFPDSTSVLFIDQVDAISEVSGRQGQIREILFRLIKDAYHFAGVKIVVSCRKFDLENDSRLKGLKSDNRIIEVQLPYLNWNEEVGPLLKYQGFDISQFNQAQKKLLQLPINLSIFLEINDKDFAFHSRSSLHEKLIEEKQKDISNKRDVHWPLIEPLQTLSNWMSQRQKLTAPVMLLDQYANAKNILSSEGLIVSSQGQINFFHESFFDHVYARAFINQSKSLVELLTTEGNEQYLFRRTQIRQILETLRKYDSDRYIKELRYVIKNDNVRFHIKVAVSQWLSSVVDPSEEEFSVISSFNNGEEGYHQFFRKAVLSSSAWFELLNEKNWIKPKLNDSEKLREPIFHWLSNITNDYSSEIAEILDSWWNGSNNKAGRLLKWFGYANISKEDRELIDLCGNLINSKPSYFFEGQGRDQISMLIHSWDEKTPEGFGQILKKLFQAWFNVHPKVNPFNIGILEAFGTHSLNRISEEAFVCFLEGTTDLLIKTIDLANKGNEGVVEWYGFDRRTYAGHRMDFDEFLNMYREALKLVADEHPEKVDRYLGRLDPHEHEVLMHLHLEAIQANPSFLADRMGRLVSDQLVFKAGWNGARWYSFAHAFKKSMHYISEDDRKYIEREIIRYRPELDACISSLRLINDDSKEAFWTKERVILQLNSSGFAQWCILETIDQDFLTLEETKTRLKELRRKFSGKEIAKPRNTAAGFVPSPIDAEECVKMGDEAWLSAIGNYDGDPEKRKKRDFMAGGARQLAGQLQQEVKKAPNRFAKLGLKIPHSAPETYFTHLLWGLAESEDLSEALMLKIIRHADNHPEKPFGKEIAHLIHKKSYLASKSEILNILINYAINGAFEKNINRNIPDTEEVTIDKLILKSRNDYGIGMNSVRGRAWEAIASIYWEFPSAGDKICEVLDIALKREPEVYVRCCMLQALIPLFNSDKDKFSKFIKLLIEVPDGSDISRLTPLMTSRGLYIFSYIFNSLPGLANELVEQFLKSDDRTIELIGSWLIYRESFIDKKYISLSNKLASQSLKHERLLANLTSKAVKWAENRNRAKSLLKTFFHHDDSIVRQSAAKSFRNIPEDEIEKFLELIDSFIDSPAFNDHSTSVINIIEKANCDTLEILVKATEKLISMPESQNAPHGNRTTDLHQIQKLLKQEYSSSQKNYEMRSRILDLIDEMLKKELYGADQIVRAHDRW